MDLSTTQSRFDHQIQKLLLTAMAYSSTVMCKQKETIYFFNTKLVTHTYMHRPLAIVIKWKMDAAQSNDTWIRIYAWEKKNTFPAEQIAKHSCTTHGFKAGMFSATLNKFVKLHSIFVSQTRQI